MLPNFAVLPPEVNSARVFAGAGSAPMLAAAAAWDDLASELHCAAMSFGSVTSGLVVGWWQGSASAAMVDAAASYIGWLSTSAAHAEGAAGLARAAVSVFEEALAATVHPAMVAANRAQVASLVASNLFGQNAPAIAALESLYEWMWAQDAAAMAGYYVGASAVATQLASWLQRLQSIPGAASLDARLPSSAEAPMGVVRAVNSAIAANAAAAQTVGLVMGGSGTPIPSARYVELANALYMSGSVPGVIAQALFTPQGLYPVVVIKNLTFDSSVAQGAVILESAIRQQIAAGNNVTVFGYSQSATISSLVMANLAASAEPPRHVRRLQFLERMGSCQVVHRGGTRRSCVSGRCGWSQRSAVSTIRSGQRSVRSPVYLVLAARRRCVSGCARRRSMPAHGPGPRPKNPLS